MTPVPRVLFRTDPETGARLEPIEEVQVDVDEEYAGVVVEALSERRAEMTGTSSMGSRRVPVSGSLRNSTRGRLIDSSKPSRRMVSIRTPSCNSPRKPRWPIPSARPR